MFPSRLLSIIGSICFASCHVCAAEPPHVDLSGEVGHAADVSAARFQFAPFNSLPWLRADLTNEKVSEHDKNFHNVMRRPYKHYSGDISGRFMEIMALDSRGKMDVHPEFRGLLKAVLENQRPGGYFCASGIIDWQQPLDYVVKDESLTKSRMLPALWGNSRMLCGLVEVTRAFPDNKPIATATRRLGDFYVSMLPRFNDPTRTKEYEGAGSYAAGHVTCWFPAMEGLVKLSQLTGDKKYLNAAIKMAEFYQRFDKLPIDHAHGMLCNQVSLVLLYEATNNPAYLSRVEKRWEDLITGGYVNPAGGILEKCHVEYERDEGCGIADWLRLNLALGKATGNPRYWAMAERSLHNHFLQNQHPNGGFGHRYVMTDSEGVYGFKKRNYESTWCCSFHGELAFAQLRRHLIERSDDLLTINFPLEFSANDGVGRVTSLHTLPWKDSHVIRQRISLNGQQATRIRVRHPHWADEVIARSGWGKPVELESRDGWHTTKEPVTEVLFVYTGGVYAEDRHCNRLPDGPKANKPFVIGYGPKLYAMEGKSATTPTWPTTLKQMESHGLRPLSSAERAKPCCFVMGCGE
ncbi:MAG: glycoside hydrolase family 127 protein [Verrucomicrobiae bacterium]|nr:glycoside hydrolase family 127 protein [Verrucomicrobiae bacterium]NNJ87131.1 hypothetical protein [Akkermansiaceae bacterium]